MGGGGSGALIANFLVTNIFVIKWFKSVLQYPRNGHWIFIEHT